MRPGGVTRERGRTYTTPMTRERGGLRSDVIPHRVILLPPPAGLHLDFIAKVQHKNANPLDAAPARRWGIPDDADPPREGLVPPGRVPAGRRAARAAGAVRDARPPGLRRAGGGDRRAGHAPDRAGRLAAL